jgi:hypothetical protein
VRHLHSPRIREEFFSETNGIEGSNQLKVVRWKKAGHVAAQLLHT